MLTLCVPTPHSSYSKNDCVWTKSEQSRPETGSDSVVDQAVEWCVHKQDTWGAKTSNSIKIINIVCYVGRVERRADWLWRRANARNVRLYYLYWQYTTLFIFRFAIKIISLNLKMECLFTFEWLTFIRLTFNTTLLPCCCSCFSPATRFHSYQRLSLCRWELVEVTEVQEVRLSLFRCRDLLNCFK